MSLSLSDRRYRLCRKVEHSCDFIDIEQGSQVSLSLSDRRYRLCRKVEHSCDFIDIEQGSQVSLSLSDRLFPTCGISVKHDQSKNHYRDLWDAFWVANVLIVFGAPLPAHDVVFERADVLPQRLLPIPGSVTVSE